MTPARPLFGALACAAVMLSGCSATADQPQPTPSQTASQTQPTPTPPQIATISDLKTALANAGAVCYQWRRGIDSSEAVCDDRPGLHAFVDPAPGVGGVDLVDSWSGLQRTRGYMVWRSRAWGVSGVDESVATRLGATRYAG